MKSRSTGETCGPRTRACATGQFKAVDTPQPMIACRAIAVLFAVMVLAAGAVHAQKISPPVFGQYTAGDDYFLGNYTQLLEYWNKVVKETDRMHLQEIGKTAEGRPIIMAI